MNRIVKYLYRNFIYGYGSSSRSMYLLAKICFVLIISFFALSIVAYINRQVFDEQLLIRFSDTLLKFGYFLSVIITYLILNKYFLPIEKVDNFITNEANESYLKKTKWIIMILILIPSIILFISGPSNH